MIDNNKNLKTELIKFFSKKKKPMNLKLRERKNFFDYRVGVLNSILKKLMN